MTGENQQSGIVADEYDLAVYEAHSLAEAGGLASTKQIADVMGMTPSGIVRRLNGMARRGLLRKYYSPAPDGSADWWLTVDGITAVEKLRRTGA